MKKHAICIQCHSNPELINYIVSVFPKEQFDFFIHVDIKSNIIEQIEQKSNVHCVSKVDVRWGRFSQVEATLEILNQVNGKEYQYIHLISGNCFPALSPQKMYELLENDNTQYIGMTSLMDGRCTWSWHGADRYLVWYPQWMIQRPANKVLRYTRIMYREFIMRTRVFRRKKLPVSSFYGGSSWFSITGEAIEWIKVYLSEHSEYTEFFKHGVCSDEVFFCTLMAHSPYKDIISNDAKRFMIWKGTNNGGPMILQPNHAKQICDSQNFWCRKVKSIDTMQSIVNNWIDK